MLNYEASLQVANCYVSGNQVFAFLTNLVQLLDQMKYRPCYFVLLGLIWCLVHQSEAGSENGARTSLHSNHAALAAVE